MKPGHTHGGSLFPDGGSEPVGALVLGLKPDGRSAEWVWVRVQGARAVRIPTSAIGELGITTGGAWTAELSAAAETAAGVHRAKNRALRLLKGRGRSRAELLERLDRAGIPRNLGAAAIEQLEAAGLVDDDGLARSRIEAMLARGVTAASALMDALQRHGIAGDVALRAVSAATAGRSEHSRAVAAAAASMARLPKGLTREVRYRRVLSALGRRGFSEEAAVDAAAEVIGLAADYDGACEP